MSEKILGELSPLDVLVFLAERWMLLLLGPLAAGAIGYVATAQLPAEYSATLELAAEVPSLSTLYQDDLPSLESATAARRGSKIVITATGPSQEEAEGNVVAASDELIAPMAEALNEHLGRLLQTRARLSAPLAPLSVRDDAQAVLATAELLLVLAPIDEEILQIEEALYSLGTTQEVSLRSEGFPRHFVVVLLAIATFIVLLLASAFQQYAREATMNETTRRKLAQIRRALLLQDR